MSVDLQKLIQFAVENNASDLHLQALAAPMVRVSGQMRALKDAEVLTKEQTLDFIASIAPETVKDDLEAAIIRGLDFSYAVPDLCRFRCSAYRHLGQPGLVMRIIRREIPSIDALHLPKVIHDIALSRRGLTLLTGTTGSGKSTTLAAMIDLINNTYQTKIITVEDPIEYVHANKKALISQLEVGLDTPSFSHAIRQSLRHDPDVILVGELRDVESLRIALQAADTGHQVFSTVHSSNTAQTVERIIAMFPPAEHKLLLSQLAGSIEAIISQRLLTTLKGGRRPAVEILRGTPVTEKFILENRLLELADYVEQGEAGMQSFDQHILKLFQEEAISGTEAMRCSSHPEALAMAMRGIRTKNIGGGAKTASQSTSGTNDDQYDLET
jgi:twitching motility protein PilT